MAFTTSPSRHSAGRKLPETPGYGLAVQGANNVNGARAFQYDCLDNAEDQLWFDDQG
ncbi:hypothetical protein GCM10027598_47890 [Amycolatopsis oliviviridis]|uniref:Uncharacterized protein n=1 Tax=Amycolatopsis oliviviridis TaxID=1471590 RepID=A0ABQ3MAH4_9PSEU|nr:hypothetical protein GCM10017790_82730 [Amycolatopsis oliviviridis]